MRSIKLYCIEHGISFLYHIVVMLLVAFIFLATILLIKGCTRYIYKSIKLFVKTRKFRSRIYPLHKYWWFIGKRSGFDIAIKIDNKFYPVKIIRTLRSGIEYAIPEINKWYKRKRIAIPMARSYQMFSFRYKRLKKDFGFLHDNEYKTIPIILFYPSPFSIVKTMHKGGRKLDTIENAEVYKNILVSDGNMFIRLLEDSGFYIESILEHSDYNKQKTARF